MPPKRLFFMTFAKKAFTISSLLAVGAGLGLPVLAQNATISGAGATFPAAFYQRAFAGVADKVRVNYQSVGSGAGVRQYVAGTVDFGATDEPIKASEAAKVKRGVIQFPAVGGTIAVAYNKADCKGLKLTQKQVVQIFLGTIKTWDELKCGKGKITVAHRSDGSGTTFAFTNRPMSRARSRLLPFKTRLVPLFFPLKPAVPLPSITSGLTSVWLVKIPTPPGLRAIRSRP